MAVSNQDGSCCLVSHLASVCIVTAWDIALDCYPMLLMAERGSRSKSSIKQRESKEWSDILRSVLV